MNILNDTSLFVAVIQQGGFSHAAKYLGLSNGLISRRIANLEKALGVSLIKRTTRQFYLTREGEVFFEHACRIQQELNSALSLIRSTASKPKGTIRISAPAYFGKCYLTTILIKFLSHFNEITVDLILTGQALDPLKEELDLVIRGVGYLNTSKLQDSSMKTKLLLTEKVRLYASPSYLLKYGEPLEPNDLINHAIINYTSTSRKGRQVKFKYHLKDKSGAISLIPKFSSNDIESNLKTCIAGHGIGKFTDLNIRAAMQQQKLKAILTHCDWGNYHLYAIYSQQQTLPRRTRLLLDFIVTQCHNLR